ncbi:glycine zipper family protein, partial [Candidatus Nomurabacteria bacterium]|nr:glycine zipper family protein [Candidatus Nomurabacteria bacterium]
MLPPSVGSLDAFFETEGKINPQNEIRPQKLGLDGIIDNLLKFNADSIGNELVVDRLNVVIDRLDSILEKNSFGGLFGGFGRSMARTNGENALLPKINLKFLTESFTQISTSFKEVFAGYTKSITSSFNNIRNALNPEKLIEFLAVPIKSLMKPISESIMNLKKDVSNVFEGVGDIIAAPFRMIGNVTSFLFNKDKGYPFERLEKDIDLTNRILTAIEKSIREVLIKELQFNILERVINIDERLRASEIKTESNELQQMENVSEAARLEDQRADKQNDLLASIAEKIGGLGVAEAKKDQAEESGKGLLDKLLEKLGLGDMKSLKGLGGNLMMKGGLALGGGLLGISALSDVSGNYDKRMKDEDTFMDYLGTIGKGAASGAMIGGMLGPMGALVGGGIGAAVTGAGSLITALTPSQKEAEEKRAQAWEDQQNEVALKSLEERQMFDRNLFGESKIDESKLEQMSARELKSLLSL